LSFRSCYNIKYVIYLLYPLILLNVVKSDEFDDWSQNNFIYTDTEGIPIILEESGLSMYSLNKYAPSIIHDERINSLFIDGSNQFPSHSFFIPKLNIYENLFSDSVKIFSQLFYRKGDYDYNELGISIQTLNSDSGYLSIQGFNHNAPFYHMPQYPNDNIQNYLINYKKETQSNSTSIDFMYHLDNYHVSIQNQAILEREVESFHGGLSYIHIFKNIRFKFNPALQITNLNFGNQIDTRLATWSDVDFNIRMNNTYSLRLNSKSKTVFSNATGNQEELHILRPKVIYDKNNYSIEGGLYINDSRVWTEAQFDYMFFKNSITIGRKYIPYIFPVFDLGMENEKYGLSYFNISSIHRSIKVNIEVFRSDVLDVHSYGLIGKINYKSNFIDIRQAFGIYKGSEGINPVSAFNKLSLIFSPEIWFWKDLMFRPFFGFESSLVEHSRYTSLVQSEVPVFSFGDQTGYGSKKISHMLSVQGGVFIDRFKASYIIGPYYALGGSYPYSIETVQLIPMSQLHIIWQFWD